MNIPLSPLLKKRAEENYSALRKFYSLFFFYTLLSYLIGLTIITIGVILVISLLHFWVIIIGGIIALLGIYLIYYYSKFIFSKTPTEEVQKILVNKEDEPELFSLIEEVATLTNTKFPEKVYMIIPANASVSFVSAWKSLFNKSKKELNIGYLLLKYFDRTEIKGILAHEFGHYNQSTLKISSWMNISNKLLFKTLWNRDKDKELFSDDSNSIYGYLSRLLKLYIEFVEKQFLKLHDEINQSYYNLSQQMEYHADEYEVAMHDANVFLEVSVKLESINAYFQYLNQMYQYNLTEEDKNIEIMKDLSYYMDSKKEMGLSIDDKGILRIDIPIFLEQYKKQIIFEMPFASHPPNWYRYLHVKKIKPERSSNYDRSQISLRNDKKYYEWMIRQLYTKSITSQELSEEESKKKFESRYKKYRTQSIESELVIYFLDDLKEPFEWGNSSSQLMLEDYREYLNEKIHFQTSAYEKNKILIDQLNWLKEQHIEPFYYQLEECLEKDINRLVNELELAKEKLLEELQKYKDEFFLYVQQMAFAKVKEKETFNKIRYYQEIVPDFIKVEDKLDELLVYFQEWEKDPVKSNFDHYNWQTHQVFLEMKPHFYELITEKYPELVEGEHKEMLVNFLSDEGGFYTEKFQRGFSYNEKFTQFIKVFNYFKMNIGELILRQKWINANWLISNLMKEEKKTETLIN